MTDADLGEADLGHVVERFYQEVRADAKLGPIFNNAIADWPAHLEKLRAFWSSVMLSSGRYKGQPMVAHFRHADAMTPAAFSRWLSLWHTTTSEMLPPEQALAMQEKAERIAESLSLGIRFQQADGLAPSRPDAIQRTDEDVR